MTRGEGRKPQKRGAFGTVHKLPSGRYRALYYGPDGRRYSAPTTFVVERDARGWLAIQQAEIIRETWMPPGADDKAQVKLTLGSYAQRWLAIRVLKTRTREDYQKLLDKQILPPLGALPLASLSADAVSDWYANLNPNTPTLRARSYGLLRTILGTALTERKIAFNPCSIPGAGSVKRAHNIRPASVEELATITQTMPEQFQAMVLLAAWCAMRFGELAELRRRDIQITNGGGVLRIRRGVVRTDHGREITTPKSEAGLRDVAAPPHIIAAIRYHLDRHTAPGPDALLFPAANGVNHLAPSTLYRHYYKARAQAGREDLRFHDLRHSGAVFAAISGATLAELMGRLGHSTQMAAMRYQHVAADRDRVIAEKISELANV